MTHTLGKIWKISRAEMVILVNQQINRNLQHTLSKIWEIFWAETLTLGNQLFNKDMTHTLVKFCVVFSVNVGQDGKSTLQQESAQHTIIFVLDGPHKLRKPGFSWSVYF